MKSNRKIRLAELRELHQENGGFHDAELELMEFDQSANKLRMVLSGLRRFVGKEGRPEAATQSIELIFEEVKLLGNVNPQSLSEYGVNQFLIEGRERISINTVVGTLKFSFLSVSLTEGD